MLLSSSVVLDVLYKLRVAGLFGVELFRCLRQLLLQTTLGLALGLQLLVVTVQLSIHLRIITECIHYILKHYF